MATEATELKKKISRYDALPYFDLEYNHPSVQQEVLRMIEEEMQAFQPDEETYLEDMVYPRLKFTNAPGFQKEYERILAKTVSSTAKVEENKGAYSMQNLLDMERYSVPGPGKRDENDRAVVTKSLNNAKAQYQHQVNRLANLEHAVNSDGVARQSEEHSSSIESHSTLVQSHVRDLHQQRNRQNMERMNAQRDAMASIVKLTGKRDQTMLRVSQLKDAVSDLKQKKARTGQ